MNVERELEALKGYSNSKKVSRAARHQNESSQSEVKKLDTSTDHADKENFGVSYNIGAGLGGISYTVQ
jgi:hypothetical protein